MRGDLLKFVQLDNDRIRFQITVFWFLPQISFYILRGFWWLDSNCKSDWAYVGRDGMPADAGIALGVQKIGETSVCRLGFQLGIADDK